MDYGTLQQTIIQRLGNRIDLADLVYTYSQGRIAWWQSIFFWTSDVTDTSLTTANGVLFYTLPNGILNLRLLRLMIPGANSAYTTTAGGNFTLPQSTINVGTTSGFSQTGTLLIGGSQVVVYTGSTPTAFTGCSGGAGLVINGTGITQQAPTTTTTANITFPVTDIPVTTTLGFTSSGVISLGGTQVTYSSLDGTDFLGCVGGPSGSTVAAGTVVTQLYGIWIPLTKINYEAILEADVLSPSNVALPSLYAQYGNQIRLYPVPDLAYPLECTGNAAPAAPVQDADGGANGYNFWTDTTVTGAGWLIIASTCNEIRTGYLHGPAMAADLALEEKERRKLNKITSNLGDPKQVKLWL